MKSATIKLDEDVTLSMTRINNNKFKVSLDADLSFKRLTGDLSAIIPRKDLMLIRDSINQILGD